MLLFILVVMALYYLCFYTGGGGGLVCDAVKCDVDSQVIGVEQVPKVETLTNTDNITEYDIAKNGQYKRFNKLIFG